MSFFSNINTATDIKESGDYLGGKTLLNTGVYDATIKLAYAHEAKSGAKAINYIFDIDGKEFETTEYFSSGKDKGFKTYYEDKQGVKHHLAGYITNNDISRLTVGKEFTELSMEEKIVELYDFETRAKKKTKVNAFTDLHGKTIKLGLHKEISEYNDKVYTKNIINKTFSSKHDKTVAECLAKKETAEFINQWKEKFTSDYVLDKTNGKSEQSTQSSSPALSDDIAF